jgi:hypothetical protein
VGWLKWASARQRYGLLAVTLLALWLHVSTFRSCVCGEAGCMGIAAAGYHCRAVQWLQAYKQVASPA